MQITTYLLGYWSDEHSIACATDHEIFWGAIPQFPDHGVIDHAHTMIAMCTL